MFSTPISQVKGSRRRKRHLPGPFPDELRLPARLLAKGIEVSSGSEGPELPAMMRCLKKQDCEP